MLCEVEGEWAAAIESEHREYHHYQHNKISKVVRRTAAEIRQGVRAILPPRQRTELEGWCDLRINRADLLAVFPIPVSPTVRENLDVIAQFLQHESQSPDLGVKKLLAPNRGGNTLPPSFAQIKVKTEACAERLGHRKEVGLLEAVKKEFPGQRVPRSLVRKAMKDLWGKPRIGAPPKSPR